jgi:hypothetical protein
MNVLDWPDGDTKGQVQQPKGNHATFARRRARRRAAKPMATCA